MKIINKYIYTEFITPFIYCFFSFLLIFIVGNLFENLDDFIQEKAPWGIIAKYYLFLAPSVFIWTVPLAVLLSILYLLGYMSKHNELNALKSSGVSFWRIAVPFGIVGLTLSLTMFAVNEWMVPPCNQELGNIRSSYLQKQQQQNDMGDMNHLAFFSSSNDMSFYFDKINLNKNEAQGVSIREFNLDGSLKREWYAKKCCWLDGQWWLLNGYVRRINNTASFGSNVGAIEDFRKQKIPVTLLPKDLIQTQRAHETIGEKLNFTELRRYIQRTYTPQTVPRKLVVDLYRKLSLPITVMVVTIFGVAFGSRISKGGALASVGISIGCYLVYYGFSSFLLALGKMEKILPAIAVWTPQIIFVAIGVWFLKQVR